MGRFRTYKNGIYGHRYKDLYVVRTVNPEKDKNGKEHQKKGYYVINAEKEKLTDKFDNYWDAEWEIDKITASQDMKEFLQNLYNEDFFTINRFFLQLMEKEEKNEMNENEAEFFYWVKKIRERKAKGKNY